MSRVFADNAPDETLRSQIDRKRRLKLSEKKRAAGHARGCHEQTMSLRLEDIMKSRNKNQSAVNQNRTTRISTADKSPVFFIESAAVTNRRCFPWVHIFTLRMTKNTVTNVDLVDFLQRQGEKLLPAVVKSD